MNHDDRLPGRIIGIAEKYGLHKRDVRNWYIAFDYYSSQSHHLVVAQLARCCDQDLGFVLAIGDPNEQLPQVDDLKDWGGPEGTWLDKGPNKNWLRGREPYKGLHPAKIYFLPWELGKDNDDSPPRWQAIHKLLEYAADRGRQRGK